MNTGHHGSMTTLHANTAQDAMARLETMLAMAWPQLGIPVLREWITSALDIVVQCERSPAVGRVVTEISVVDDHLPDSGGGSSQLIPVFTRAGGDAIRGSGEVPRRCLERMARNGVQFPPSLFAVRAA